MHHTSGHFNCFDCWLEDKQSFFGMNLQFVFIYYIMNFVSLAFATTFNEFMTFVPFSTVLTQGVRNQKNACQRELQYGFRI